MAILQTHTVGNATLHICDDALGNQTPEQRKQAQDAFEAVLHQILANPEVRKRLMGQKGRQGGSAGFHIVAHCGALCMELGLRHF